MVALFVRSVMRRYLYIVLALLLMGCVSSVEPISAPQVGVVPQQLTVEFEQPLSRSVVQGERFIYWCDGDEISLFPRTSDNLQYRLQSVEAERAKFVRVGDSALSGESLSRNYGVYPYSEATAVTADGNLRVVLPALQNYAKDSFGDDSATMVAVADDANATLRFQSIVGFLKLQLYGENIRVKRIEFGGNRGEKVAGTALVSVADSSVATVAMEDSATDIVTLDCGEGVLLGNDSTKPTAFWLALPPQLFAEGFVITIYDDKGTAYVKSTSKPYTIDANMIQPMKAVDVAGDTVLDIEEYDGKVLFYLAERSGGVRSLSGIAKRDWLASKVVVNGKTYNVALDGNQQPCVLVDASESESYEAALFSDESEMWYSISPRKGVVLPCSQFESSATTSIASFPMFATYKKRDGRTLVFDDGFAVVRLRLRGNADIVSVRIESEQRYDLAGKISEVASDGLCKVTDGTNFVALNCTNSGSYAPLSSGSYRDFYLMIAPNDYSDGLRLSVCDRDYKAMFFDLKDVRLGAGEIYTLEADYAPDEDLVFYQGFDNCVWGGDIVRGMRGTGFAPDAKTIGTTSQLARTGYEQALVQVAYNNPGSAYIQSNNWDNVTGKTVATSHQVSDSYIVSRHFDDYKYLFRTQEHPGYLAIGTASTVRGILNSPLLLNTKGIGSHRVKVRFAMQANFDGVLEWRMACVGHITRVRLNGADFELTAENCKHEVRDAILLIKPSQLKIASSANVAKEWNTIEIDVADCANGARVYVRDENVNKGVHGIYLDNIEVRQIDEWKRTPSHLRVLLWNIQNGMWADQHNNYDNFVKWVAKWDPDICIWCESETIYKDKTNSATSTKYLPDGWVELCKRYGHTYAEVGGNRDNYPQTVTSKYPISVVQRFTSTNVSGKNISHGAGHFTITKDGKKINIVTMHMWPQSYSPSVSTAEREESTANGGGDLYRAFEVQYLVDQTVNNPKYASEKYWLVGGDTNASSRLDNWYNGFDENSTKLLVHDIFLEQTSLKDVIGHRYPGHFFATTMSGKRIDILYASPEMYRMMDNSIVLLDEWIAPTAKSTYYSGFYDTSDHHPLLIDFNLSR